MLMWTSSLLQRSSPDNSQRPLLFESSGLQSGHRGFCYLPFLVTCIKTSPPLTLLLFGLLIKGIVHYVRQSTDFLTVQMVDQVLERDLL